MKYKNQYLILFLVPCSLCLVACSNKNQNSKKIFRYNESTGIASLDPAFSKNQSTMWPVHQLFNTLVENEGDTKTKGSLAKGWDISVDGTEYIFHLRDDVYFHDNDVFAGGKGRKMTAADIVYKVLTLGSIVSTLRGFWCTGL
jgi:peptide/nickel transport system substrate-binding protein